VNRNIDMSGVGWLRLSFLSLSLGFSRALGVLALLFGRLLVCVGVIPLPFSWEVLRVRSLGSCIVFLARTMYLILGWLEGRVIRMRRRSWS
jgi:hypothetical protein